MKSGQGFVTCCFAARVGSSIERGATRSGQCQLRKAMLAAHAHVALVPALLILGLDCVDGPHPDNLGFAQKRLRLFDGLVRLPRRFRLIYDSVGHARVDLWIADPKNHRSDEAEPS